MSETKTFNIKSFIKGDKECKDHTISAHPDVLPAISEPAAPKSSRKKSVKVNNVKDGSTEVSTSVVTPLAPTTSLSYIQENIPYASAYTDTMGQLDESIGQLNVLGAELVGDLQQVRASKTLKGKYNYITDMTNTVATIISSKISAIREKNKCINDANHLELSRMKELKSTMNEQDDNARIASLYDAFVNMPMGGGPNVLGPSMQDMMISSGSNLPRMALGGMDDQAMWEANLNPAENRMLLEAKGAIDTVVVYDNATGNRYYDVIDKATGQSVPNVDKPSDNTLYELDINIRGGFAKDQNRNVTYPLIVLNADKPDMSEF